MDIISYARDKGLRGGLPLGVLQAGALQPPHSANLPSPPTPDTCPPRCQPADVLTVYAGYATGLAEGACVRLHVTRRTEARTVVRLVVQQLNYVVERRGLTDSFYSDDNIDSDFCLVAVTTAGGRRRETALPPDCLALSAATPQTKLCVKLRGNCSALLRPTSV